MSLRDRLDEFRRNVWDHSVDPFQTAFEERRALEPSELGALRGILKLMKERGDETAIAHVLHSTIVEGQPEMMDIFLQLAGITRNKILQDLKGHARAGGLSLRLSNYARLAFHDETWNLAGRYLAKRLGRVLGHVAQLADPDAALEALNQATWPGYMRQERAKRSGHEAEHRVACLLKSCRIPFEPEEKAHNPLCRDADVRGVSFDIVVPHSNAPKVVVKATVHTANIGQYGESKDHLEVDQARRMLDREFSRESRPLLLAFIDGVGFESNRAGLTGVLKKSDEFCQFRTIWKGPVMAARSSRAVLRLLLPRDSILAHKSFLRRYGFLRRTRPRGQGRPCGAIEAGEGLIETQE